MKSQLKEMFEIQNTLNASILGNNYAEKNTPFRRAALVEAAELMEHTGYKWWKKNKEHTEEDTKQAQLEIVDIWHFLMSHILQETDDLEDKIQWIALAFKHAKETYDSDGETNKLESVDGFVKELYGDNSITATQAFARMVYSYELTFDHLYEMYIGKNALNFFRQENGYKEGTYNKNKWVSKNGEFVEDNVVLAEILENPWETFDDIHAALTDRYQK